MRRSWDAEAYHRLSSVMDPMAIEVLDRLELRGDEIVLDAGCGSGRITARLLERLPEGRVIAVDADPAMVEQARRNLGTDRVEIHQIDLLELDLTEEVDAVFSTATLHWVLDHQRLFERLFAALRPGGRVAAQGGGVGNVEKVVQVADAVARETEYAAWFDALTHPWYFAGVDETERDLRAAGFDPARAWFQRFAVEPEDPVGYLATIPLGSWLDLLPEERRRPFTEEVAARLGRPLVVDYIRLNIDATKPPR